jgi:hypothetical protein
MRVYSGWKPFISDEHDKLAEVAQWQLFFVMFAALLIRVNMDGESLQDKVYFDLMLVFIQFAAPGLLFAKRLIPKKQGRMGRFLSAASDLTGIGSFGVFEAAEDLKSEFGGGVEMVSNPLDKNRELRAASSGKVGLGGEVVSKKQKKKTKGDVEKDKRLFQRLGSGGYKKKVIGVGKKGLLEVKNSAPVEDKTATATLGKGKEAEKKKVYIFKDAEAGDPDVKETGSVKAGGIDDGDDDEEVPKSPPAASATSAPTALPPPPTWEKHKDEESGAVYYHNSETNETTWEDPIQN